MDSSFAQRAGPSVRGVGVVTNRLRPAGVLAAAVLAGAACANLVDAGEIGEVRISGSSTVEPISALVAERFAAANPNVAISVDGPGTSDGFELFCDHDVDITGASRPIQEEEIQACEDNGVDFIELKIAVDGISVITSREGEIAQCLDFRDLYALLGPESQGFDRWSDANEVAAEIGAGHAPFPDVPLVVTAPGEESGTYDTFVELVIAGLAEERGREEESRPDYQASANDNVIIQGVSGSPTSLGWVGFAFYTENQAHVRALAVDGGQGCVAPDHSTIADGTYPIARPLFLYVNRDNAATNPTIHDLVDFYLSDEGLALVEEVGYVRLGDDDIHETRSAWGAGRTGRNPSWQ
jgi:phosphate transport system substrate-binding protein